MVFVHMAHEFRGLWDLPAKLVAQAPGMEGIYSAQLEQLAQQPGTRAYSIFFSGLLWRTGRLAAHA